MFYWVVQVYKGETRLIGPYSQEQSAENRRAKSHGGQLILFRSSSNIASEAREEFMGEKLAGRV